MDEKDDKKGDWKIEIVRFDGDELQVAGEHGSGDGWASVKSISDALGVSFSRQVKKLKASKVATVAMKATVAQDGKTRELFCIRIRSIPYWLAGIHASKVKPEVREKLIRYQREAHDVLAAHFMGAPSGSDASGFSFSVKEIVETTLKATLPAFGVAMLSAMRSMLAEERELRAEAQCIPPFRAREIRRVIRELAMARSRTSSDPKAYRRERSAIDDNTRAQFNFFGSGRRWDTFPLNKWQDMASKLEEYRREIARLYSGAQLKLL